MDGAPRRLAAGVRVRTLVADDVAENRDILGSLLEAIGAQVEVAVDGPEALAKAASEQFDIIFLDIRMPQMGGEEVLRRLQANRATEAIPVVAVTASVLEHERQSFLDMGFADFVPKPVQFERLYVALEIALDVEWAEEGDGEGSEDEEEDWGAIVVPDELRQRLLAAAQSYGITELEEGLRELAELGAAQEHLVRHLRSMKERYDMEGIGRVLGAG